MKHVYDASGRKVPGLYKKDDAFVVIDPIALQKATAEKERMSRIDQLETQIDQINNDIHTIKTLLEHLIRDNNG